MPFFPAITAWSAVNALGVATSQVLARLDDGVSGLGASPFVLPFDAIVGVVPGLDDSQSASNQAASAIFASNPGLDRYDCRQARVALAAFSEIRTELDAAVSRWGARRVAIILGTSTGGLRETESAYFDSRESGVLSPRFDLHRQHSFNAAAELIAELSGARGPVYTLSTACSSSGKTAAVAMRLMQAGLIDAALVGGVDSLCRMTLQGFHGLGVLSSTPCRPFGAGRNGINIGEGAAFVMLEREGKSPVSLLGVGESADAFHMSSPHPEGRGAAEAMSLAMKQGGFAPTDVDHINAHGTATLLNDQAEAFGIHSVFQSRIPVSSTKAYTGHTLGAAAATELVFAIHAVTTGRIPQTLGALPIDPNVRIDIVTEARHGRVRRALSNSCAFGGSNVSLLVGEP